MDPGGSPSPGAIRGWMMAHGMWMARRGGIRGQQRTLDAEDVEPGIGRALVVE